MQSREIFPREKSHRCTHTDFKYGVSGKSNAIPVFSNDNAFRDAPRICRAKSPSVIFRQFVQHNNHPSADKQRNANATKSP